MFYTILCRAFCWFPFLADLGLVCASRVVVALLFLCAFRGSAPERAR